MHSRHIVAAALSLALAACGGGGSDAETLDSRVRNLSFGGTVISDSSFYGDGQVTLRVVPLDRDGKAVLENGIKFSAAVTSPAGLSVGAVSGQCIQIRERHPLSLGIVVDASSSMAENDPDDATGAAPGRRLAVREIVDIMSPGDVAALTDFSGTSATPLRDVVCAASSAQTPAPPCIASSASFTSNTTALRNSTVALRNMLGTPLYDACQQMTTLLGPFADRKAMVILSDGLPDDASARAQCLDRARSANVSIFTVGFGSSASGTTALRDLAEATGGAYAPSQDPAQLNRVLANMGYSDGYCDLTFKLTGTSTIAPGTPVVGEVTAGTSGARAAFEFLAPPRS